MGHVIAITGTRREASVLRGHGVECLAIGGAEDALDRVVQPVDAVVSFGMAGALSPDLRIGDWIIGSKTCGALEVECDADWQAALAKCLPQARIGPVYADGRLIADPAEKRALSVRHGALAADMESHLAGRLAVRLGVPFAIVRCISDDARHALPPAIAVAMKPDGGLALGNVLRSIARKPGQMLDIVTTIIEFNRAFSAMKKGLPALSGRLAFDLR